MRRPIVALAVVAALTAPAAALQDSNDVVLARAEQVYAAIRDTRPGADMRETLERSLRELSSVPPGHRHTLRARELRAALERAYRALPPAPELLAAPATTPAPAPADPTSWTMPATGGGAAMLVLGLWASPALAAMAGAGGAWIFLAILFTLASAIGVLGWLLAMPALLCWVVAWVFAGVALATRRRDRRDNALLSTLAARERRDD